MLPLKRTFFALIIFLFLASTIHADVVDRIVAIVNDDVITLSEVNEEGKVLLQRVAETVPPSELPEALKQVRQKIIQKLIEKKIMLQEAKKADINVSDEEVEMAFKRILERNKITPEILQNQLAEVGMDVSKYKEDLRAQVLSSKLVNMEIRSKVIIPEDRIIDYYDTHYTERVGEGGFYLLQIGISWDEKGNSTRDAARNTAEKVRKLAVDGGDFRELAKEYSDLPSSVDGGDIGVLRKDDMSPDMKDILMKTKPGGISPIIETSSGFQFFKVLSSQEGQIIAKVSYESVKDEIYETLYQQEMEARYMQWFKEMKSKAYIKIL